MSRAFEADVSTLRQAGFDVEPVGQSHADFRRCQVRRGDHSTKVEWVYDSAFRFFPVEPDLALGWRLNFWDAATNKVLALVGRQKVRDYLDCLYLHGHHLHLGALAWAAAAKDPGLSPELIIDWAGRGNRFRPEDLLEVKLGKPVDLRDSKRKWLIALDEARQLIEKLPMPELGCLYLDAAGHPVCPDPASPDFAKLTRHFGCVKGAWPSVVEE
ncbi:MAG: hypothetical protein HYY24_07120 [Verrucomicrobia bacterium]|nr:hypothetical protein [Verrucomicrobiota bacterium]